MDGKKTRRYVCTLLLAALVGFPGIYLENLEKAQLNQGGGTLTQTVSPVAVPPPWQQGLFTPASGDPGTLLRSGTLTEGALTEGGAEGGGSAPAMTEGGTLLTDANRVSGLALVSAAAASPGWEAPPAWASAHGPWQACGVNRDFFGILLTDGPAPEHCPWDAAAFPPFPVGTNLHTRLFVSSCGAVSFGSPARLWPDGRPVPDGSDAPLFAPLLGNLGVAPPEGAFWHGVSPSNTLLLTWRDVYLDRDSNLAASAQCELRPSGDFAFRVRLPEGADPSGFATAVQNAGGGEAFPWDSNTLALARSPGGVEIRGRGFGALPPGGDDETDSDGDGLTDAEEVFTWGTDPRLPDTDFDGLSDAGELAAGTDPHAPDSDGDGLADGIDPDPLVWDDPDGDAGNDGLGYLFEAIHGLDPAADNALDSDGDGWADWKELMAGTDPDDMSSVPVNIDGIQTQVPVLFEATVTLNASLPCDALLRVGDRTVVLRQARSYTLTLVEGVAYPVSVAASRPCTVSLSATLSSPYAAFQDTGGVFSGGAAVPGGAPVACGMIAQPAARILPERVCFHSGAPKTVAAKVSPPMAGSYRWDWYGGDISSVTGRSANISWDGGDSLVCLSFTASGAAQPRCGHREVTRCAKVDEDTWCDDHGCEHWYCACDNDDASGDDDCGFHGQKVSKCRESVCPTHGCPYDGCPDGWCHRHDTWYSDCDGWWCHMHDRPLSECDHDETPGGDPGTGGETAAPGEPVFGSGDLSLAAVNNDDDDASGAEDSGEAPVAGENDLAAVWPLGYFDGQCCPCPEHRVPPEGSQSAELESCSTRLALWADAAKADAFGATVGAGQAVWVEGLSASPSVGADRVVWKWTDGDSHVHRVTNAFTVLSVRLFGDIDLDGDVDADDKALHPALSRETGWAVPAAPGVLRPVRLRTDVGLSGGAYTLTLAGTPGAFRIWPDASGTNAPLLECGQTVTNGANGIYFLSGENSHLYVEAASNSTSTLIYRYIGTDGATDIICSTSMKMTGYIPSVSISNPDSIEWNDLPEKKVILSDQEIRIKISVSPALPNLVTALNLFGAELKVMTSETCPSGQQFALTEQNATLIQADGTSEIRIALNRPQLVSIGLLPTNDQDGVHEKAWMDYGVDDPTMPSNLNDGMAFNSNLSGASRGRCTGVGNLNSSTTNSPVDKSFLVAAGREIITAEFGGVVCQRRQIMNQADIFYFSGHGNHSDGTLEGIGTSDVGNYWQQDLDIVVLSACSVLDINDYNGHYSGPDHIASPGKLWEQTGPTYFLGYNYTAPNDLQGTETIIAYWIANRASLGEVEAWRNANSSNSGRNACAIENGTGYYYFHRTGIYPFYQYTWTFVPKANW